MSSLGDDAPLTPAPGALPLLNLCWCFLWHEPGAIPGWAEFPNPQVLHSPFSLACSLHTASLAALLCRCVPGSPAPSCPPQLTRSISVPSVFPERQRQEPLSAWGRSRIVCGSKTSSRAAAELRGAAAGFPAALIHPQGSGRSRPYRCLCWLLSASPAALALCGCLTLTEE